MGKKIALIVVVAIVAIVAADFAYHFVNEAQSYGKVQFSYSSTNSCSISNTITSAPEGSTVYFMADLKDHFNGTDVINISVTLDGTSLGSAPVPATGKSFDCVYEQVPADMMDTPGTYVLDFTDASGKEEASGTFTVTP